MEQKKGVVYKNVVELARKKNLSLTKVEELAKIGNGAIGKWNPERDDPKNPSLETLMKLSAFFGVSVNRLLKE